MINVIIFIFTIAHCTSAEFIFNKYLNQNLSSAQTHTPSTTPTFYEFSSQREKLKSSQHYQYLYSPEMDEQTKNVIAECFKKMSTEERESLNELSSLGLIPESMHSLNRLTYARAYATLPDDTVRFRLGLPTKDMVLLRLRNLKSIYEKGISLKTRQKTENNWTHEEYEEALFKRLKDTG